MEISKNTKTAIYIGIALATVGFLFYRQKKNKEEATILLDFIAKMPSQVDLSKATDTAIVDVRKTKYNPNKIKIDNLYGAYKTNPAIKKAIANTVTELYASMKGVGTDEKPFFKALNRIKNKNTLMFVDLVYKAMFKQGLFEAMKEEVSLNNVQYGVFSDKTKYDLAIPLLSEGKWHPALASIFNRLPVY